jgi:hypothetical protein
MRPPLRRHLGDSLLRPLRVPVSESQLPKIALAKRRAQRRDLPGRDMMFVVIPPRNNRVTRSCWTL